MDLKEKTLSQVGSSWANMLQDIGYLYNIPEITYETIEKMLKDETIQAALRFYIFNVLNYLSSYTHDDPGIEEFVRENFENLDQTLELVLEQLLFYKKAYGFAVGELVWEIKNNQIILKRIVPLPPTTIQFRVSNGEIVGIRQITPTKTTDISSEKLLILREGFKPYGDSVLKYLYRPWKFKGILFKFWAMAMERYAAPVLVGKTPNPAKVDELLKDLEEVWSNGIISVTNDVDISTLEVKNSVTEPFKEAIEYANILIYRGLLLPQLLAGSSNIGSYALGKVHLDLFMTTIRQETQKLANDLIDQVVSRIIEYNYGPFESYGRFLERENITSDERAKLAQALSYLVQAGFLDPVKDSKWARELLRFPNPMPEGEEELEDDEIWQVLEQSQKRWIEQKNE